MSYIIVIYAYIFENGLTNILQCSHQKEEFEDVKE